MRYTLYIRGCKFNFNMHIIHGVHSAHFSVLHLVITFSCLWMHICNEVVLNLIIIYSRTLCTVLQCDIYSIYRPTSSFTGNNSKIKVIAKSIILKIRLTTITFTNWINSKQSVNCLWALADLACTRRVVIRGMSLV